MGKETRQKLKCLGTSLKPLILFIFVIFLCTSGCNNKLNSILHEPNERLKSNKTFEVNVYIKSIIDNREFLNEGWNEVWMLVPLVPYVWNKYQNNINKKINSELLSRIGGSAQELPKLLQKYFMELNVFKNAVVEINAENLQEIDFIAEIHINKWSLYEAKTFYGISALWGYVVTFIGIPNAYYKWEIDYDIKLKKNENNNKYFFTKNFKEEIDFYHIFPITINPLSYIILHSTSNKSLINAPFLYEYDDLIDICRKNMEDFTIELTTDLKNKPPVFWDDIHHSRQIRVARANGRSPTTITVEYLRDGMEADATIPLRGQVSSELALKALAVSLNDQPVNLAAPFHPGAQNVSLNSAGEISLRPGDNFLRIVAVDEAGLRAEREIRVRRRVLAPPLAPPQPVYQPPPTEVARPQPVIPNSLAPRRCWAVVVGISKYQHASANLPNLQYAHADAIAFAQLLRDRLGWPAESIKLLTDEKATKREIEAEMRGFLSQAGENDLILLYWSGHGMVDPITPTKVYFVCHDTEANRLPTGYRMDEARLHLDEHRARHLVILADTCHAGKLITRDARSVTGIVAESLSRGQNAPGGSVFMVSADTDRQAIESDDWRHGVFTKCLLDGLNGSADGYDNVGPRDGLVSLGELKVYLERSMKAETFKKLGVATGPNITTDTGDSKIWELSLRP